MGDGLTRWSQLVRTPGTVMIHAHHAQTVPPVGGATPENAGVAGIRLLTTPIAAAPGAHAIDITSSAVVAMLSGFLASGVAGGKLLSWQSRGRGRRRRDTIALNWGTDEP